MTWSKKPNQIVCLDHEDSRLYCSAISFISARQFFWVRPLMLTIIAHAGEDYLEIAKVVDLRFTADLIWPKNFFRPALDTEVIGLLWQLEELYCPSENLENARQELRCFIDKVWHHWAVKNCSKPCL